MQSYTTSAKRALDLAISFSAAADDGYIGTEHLLYGLLHANTDSGTPCIAAKLLSSHGISRTALRAAMNPTMAEQHRQIVSSDEMSSRIEAAYPNFTPILCRILKRAEEEAKRFRLASDAGGAVVGSEHLLFSLLCETDAAAHHILARHNLPLHELYGDVLSFLSAVTAEEAIFSSHTRDDTDSDVKHAEDPSHPKSAGLSDMLPFLLDMTACAAQGKYDAVVARDAEEEAVLRILLHKQKNNPCLLGEAGVGKTAIVEGIAAKIANGLVPSVLIGAQVLSLDLGGMLAGAKYRGEFEERLRRVLQYCHDRSPSVILFIDEVHMLMGAGAAEGTVDAANLLKPALSRGEIRVIGATTRTEYDKTIGRDGAMSRRFQPVIVEEPDRERALRMLTALVPRLQSHHGVHIAEDVPRCAIDAAVRYLPEYYLPDKAIDLLDDACASVRYACPDASAPLDSPIKQRDDALLYGDMAAAQKAVQSSQKEHPEPMIPSMPTVTTEDIHRAAERRTGIKVTANDENNTRYLTLESHLNNVVLGQEKAVAQIAETLRRRYIGVSSNRRTPISFLFYGPSGVGKTAICEALAAHLFDSAHALIRFDMSEYRESHAVSRLIGAPPGYIGHDDGGVLTTAIRHRPYALVLFDAFEKAHPDVRNLILQLLDSGSLTDSRGGTVSFRHAIVVLTVSADAASHTHPLGFSAASAKMTDCALPKSVCTAELMSHIDETVYFSALRSEVLTQIVQTELTRLCAHMKDHGITFSYDDTLIPYILRLHPNEQGARGLQRTAAQMTEVPLSKALVNQTISAGDHVLMTVKNEKIALIKNGTEEI